MINADWGSLEALQFYPMTYNRIRNARYFKPINLAEDGDYETITNIWNLPDATPFDVKSEDVAAVKPVSDQTLATTIAKVRNTAPLPPAPTPPTSKADEPKSHGSEEDLADKDIIDPLE